MKNLFLILLLVLIMNPVIGSSQEDSLETKVDSIQTIDVKPDFKILTIHDYYLGVNYNEDYLEGWEDGYCEGWKDVRGQFVTCPETPIAPIPLVGRDGYVDGYNRGFKQGYVNADQDDN